MITRKLEDVLFHVDIHEVYTVIKKKPQLFAGYAIINTDENRILHTVSEKYLLRTNEYLINCVKKFFPDIKFDFAHYDNDKAYFHIYFVLPSNVTGVWQWAIEIINSYNTQASPKINVAFKSLKNDTYIYTNVTLINVSYDDLRTDVHQHIIEEFSENALQEKTHNLRSLTLPRYVQNKCNSDTVLEGVAKWQKKSHSLARNWLAETMTLYLIKKERQINGSHN